ncbi:DNA-protecting protein DprA [Hazenella sp. IB182357]|uniref:DNA-protecting protein DprA n=1 Tax=Polycladospora coralii TaxID=2771432 RepID=A0A926N7J1_9BACL|nr:DNA-processing protein DprA [Polycladospora coralii]MBD1371466.1 DNA-protecting protein DprA [Polycladospora coralii]MBS7530434.1 DNA-processing protein DprA [Polycladospora coralii]
MDSKYGLIAMHQISGVGWHTIEKLYQIGWEPSRMPSEKMFHQLSKLNVSGQLITKIKKRWHAQFIQEVKKELDTRNITAITWLDEQYPPLLKEIAKPPWILYAKGQLQLLNHLPTLAIVGTRKPTIYGEKVTMQICSELAKHDWTIISGMAMGIDGEVHRHVLEVGGKTIAVLATGVDVVYPKINRKLYTQLIQDGLVISESPPGTTAHAGLFPQRNRIISGLSQGTLVIEAAERSGSLITADFSLEQGKDVFAIPGPITSDKSAGTNQLIQQGAKCVTQVDDILEEFSFVSERIVHQQQKKQVELDSNEQLIMDLMSAHPISLAEITEKVGAHMDIQKIHQTLIFLEMKGEIIQLPGMQYIFRM